MGLAVCEDVSWFVLVCGGEYVEGVVEGHHLCTKDIL